MLPPPTCSFTIPSIHDGLVLQCRVYHPACLAPTKVSQITGWRKRAAIVAHPYAPLGGCYDDPVVDIVGSTILKQGFIVGTFNFRGAGTSKGRTSWQSKPEQNDYISFIGFMVYYLHNLSPPPQTSLLPEQQTFTRPDLELHDLSPIPSLALPPPHSSDPQALSPTSGVPTPQIEVDTPPIPIYQPCLLLAGYSYGAMITGSLPPMISSMIEPFQTPVLGSAHAEIRLRADTLSRQQNEFMNLRAVSILQKMHRRGRSLKIDDHILSNSKIRKVSGGVRMGGEEDLRRASYDSCRSRSPFVIDAPERVRKSFDRVRSITKSKRFPVGRGYSLGSVISSSEKKVSGSDSSVEHISPNEESPNSKEKDAMYPITGIVDGLKMAYLLVSPLRGWVSTLATMWSSTAGNEKEFDSDIKLTVDPTLAIFGDDDVFVSARRLRGWVEKLTKTKKEGEVCQFKYRKVAGAGHFWHDYEAIQTLQHEVQEFAASL